MSFKPQRSLEERVFEAAEAALADHQYVSPIDVFVGMRLLEPCHLQDWRNGRVPFLEAVIQGNPDKKSRAMEIFQDWARERGLNPSETVYLACTRAPQQELQFSASGNFEIERAYRTHYVSPVLSEAKQEKLREKLSQAPELVVFCIVRDSKCSKCAKEELRGSFLLMEQGQPLCMACAGLDHLVYLPSGNAKLSSRARKYSQTWAVVVRFSRTRKRYERQGILVEEAALARAQKECASGPGRGGR